MRSWKSTTTQNTEGEHARARIRHSTYWLPPLTEPFSADFFFCARRISCVPHVHPTPVTHKLCVTVRVLIVRMGSTWYCNDRMQRIAQTFSHHAHESLWHLALACSRYTAYRPPTATRRRESNQQFGHVETRVPKGTVGVAGCCAFIHSLKRL